MLCQRISQSSSAIAVSLFVLVLAAGTAQGQDIAIAKGDVAIGAKGYSPYLCQTHPNRVYWGDTRLHTSYWTDAGMVGNRLGPDEALRFAKGEMVVSSTGIRARLIRPLDFLVIADHAENLGLPPMIEESNPDLLRDPDGANLDRFQIIKGWVGQDGKAEEHVHEVAWAGDRALDGDGNLAPIGSTVDLKAAIYKNDIGRAMLVGYWEDPDFDPNQSAFYYVRVLEIPTPSWLAYDRKAFGLPLPEGAVLEQQDRAYSSPIWYTPKG